MKIDLTQKQLDNYLEWSWLDIGNPSDYKIRDILDTHKWYNLQEALESLGKIMTDPNYLHFTTKYILNLDLLPYQLLVLRQAWIKNMLLLIACRGAAKSFMLAVYCILRAMIQQGIKIVVVGAGLRQSMVIFNFMETIWANAPVFRDICGKGDGQGPKKGLTACYFRIGSSEVIFLPMGSGEKIRGIRGQVIIADEFASIDPVIFEVVVRGFASVKSVGLFDNVQSAAKEKLARKLGLIVDSEVVTGANVPKIRHKTYLTDNQIIVAGSASYQFNHIYKYYNNYKQIILTKGKVNGDDNDALDKSVIQHLDSADFSVLRIPYDVIPAGMMDLKILEQGRLAMDPAIFGMEYGACFPSDSEGFYLASAIEKCTCKSLPIETSWGALSFSAKLTGLSDKTYVMGIDPASVSDDFTISIQECYEQYGVMVYQWKTNRKHFEMLKRNGFIPAHLEDYNSFCVWHIRNLNRRFHPTMILIDTGGGGISLRESLRDASKILDDRDKPLYEIEEYEKKDGQQILKMIEFSNYQWRRDAHWAVRHDLSDKRLIFPFYDAAELEVAALIDQKEGKSFDRLEDVYKALEQCKTQMTYVKHEQTSTGQERWDVPKVIGYDADDGKSVLKKDLFTSLMLANWGRRLMTEEVVENKNGRHGYVMGSASVGSSHNTPFMGQIRAIGGGRRVIF